MPKARRSLTRIFTPRPAGLDPHRKQYPFWRGRTAEQLVARRVKQYRRDTQAKRKSR